MLRFVLDMYASWYTWKSLKSCWLNEFSSTLFVFQKFQILIIFMNEFSCQLLAVSLLNAFFRHFEEFLQKGLICFSFECSIECVNFLSKTSNEFAIFSKKKLHLGLRNNEKPNATGLRQSENSLTHFLWHKEASRNSSEFSASDDKSFLFDVGV